MRGYGYFRVERKKPGEFCYLSLPWKATNGVVCLDAQTVREACRRADRANQERGQGKYARRTYG